MISIIVPVYNVEQYLNQCVDSILGQTYMDIEVILVDDGSVDSSGKICDAYAEADSRVKVFHKPNGGVSSARNLGIKSASGEYIAFVDSDDTVDYMMYEKLSRRAKAANAELVCCGHRLFNEYGTISHVDVVNAEGTGEDVLSMLIETGRTIPLWTYIVKRNIITDNSISFNDDFKYGEDQEFTMKLLCNTQSIIFIDEHLYGYRKHNSSVIVSKSLRQFDFVYAMIRLKDYMVSRKMNSSLIEHMDNCKIPSALFYVMYTLSYNGVKLRAILKYVAENNLSEYLPSCKNVSVRGLKNELILLWKINKLLFHSYVRVRYYINRIRYSGR